MRTCCLASALKRGLHPPGTNNIATRKFQGGEGLSFAHWLSYEKLNLCILCVVTNSYITQGRIQGGAVQDPRLS